MVHEPSASITDADVRSLAAKLTGLHVLLTPPEQALLRIVLGRAADREARPIDDTEGFAWGVSFNPFTYLDAIAADVGAEIEQRDGRVARGYGARRARTGTSSEPHIGGQQPPNAIKEEHSHDE